MKILHLLKSNKYSGAENVVLTIMDMSPELDMIYASPDGPIRRVVEERNHIFYPLKSSSIFDVKAAIKEIQPDIIHAHDFSMANTAAWATSKIPVIVHLHNNPLWLKKICLKSLAFAFALPKIKQVICVSKAVEDEYIFRKMMKNKNVVVGNVIDAESIKQKAQEKVKCKQVDLIFLGRQTNSKCPILFCQIVEEVKRTIPQITARMIGDGELMPKVKNYIQLHNLSENIELVGFQSNPYPYLSAGKIMVMPSAWEGFGLAAVEGMCLEKTVICSGVGGLADIVDDSCGVKCNTLEEYSRAIINLLYNKEEYIKKTKNAFIKSNQYTDIAKYANTIKELYQKALGGNKKC